MVIRLKNAHVLDGGEVFASGFGASLHGASFLLWR